MLAGEVVEEAGFIAIEARDADAAVIVLETRADITLPFTDIDMPGSMDGLKLAHAVRDRWPPIKILVVPANNGFGPPISGQTVLSLKALPGSSIGRGTSFARRCSLIACGIQDRSIR